MTGTMETMEVPGRDPEPQAAALCMDALVKELTAIEKDSQSPQGYRFRGIESVLSAIHPVLAAHSCWLSAALTKHDELTPSTAASGATWHRVLVIVEYSVRGFDGSREDWGRFPGEGSDAQDKATACAMSNALKTAVFQTFAVPVEDVVGDAEAVAFQAGAPGGSYRATAKADQPRPLPTLRPVPPRGEESAAPKPRRRKPGGVSESQVGMLLGVARECADIYGERASVWLRGALVNLGHGPVPEWSTPEEAENWLLEHFAGRHVDSLLAKLKEAPAPEGELPPEEDIPF